MNIADFAKYALPPKPKKHETLIEKADAAVDIRDVYTPITGSYVPMGSSPSWKIFCPWGYEHADGGLDKNCRLYAPTHIYCWAAHGVIKPTRLYARWKGMTQLQAAEELLDERGLLNKKNYRERWADLLNFREQKLHQKLGEQSDAIDALHQALLLDDEYTKHAYDDDVRQAWVLVLAKLDLLWAKADTDATILEEWFTRSLRRIKEAAHGQAS